jgi:hypothetical protein
MKNIHWKEVGLLSFVWVVFLVLQLTKVRTLEQNFNPGLWIVKLK